jgi:hypothetical protein
MNNANHPVIEIEMHKNHPGNRRVFIHVGAEYYIFPKRKQIVSMNYSSNKTEKTESEKYAHWADGVVSAYVLDKKKFPIIRELSASILSEKHLSAN